ncbi:hypothetical protein [Nocardioides nematodiphilus]|uniref:hypothetical protein n=1 Tax=Nocardioides nematodiphilus TaxID=2849669 RepID=UPI001CD9B20E|nr:hypothetical protein [Nocardioides nematodiphilus]MCA1982201.1 hypothetical protein [Nocardioides nematodiphilus]
MTAEELMFTIDPTHKKSATALPATELAKMQYTERDLQEWVLAHPQILGEGAMVIASEVGTWQSSAGTSVKDRLDVLALGPDGRLIVAELKRGHAPHTVHMQALNYAAMVAALSVEQVAQLYVSRQKTFGVTVEIEAFIDTMETQYLVTSATLKNPRVVMIASSFPPAVTSTTVWLKERGVDVSLIKFVPYEFPDGSHAVSFSRFFPIPTLEEFRITFDSGGTQVAQPDSVMVSVAWDLPAMRNLVALGNPTTLALLDLLAAADGESVSAADVMESAGLTTGQFRGQLAGLTMMLKNQKYGFAQIAAPWDITWLPGGFASYSLSPELAELWKAARVAGQSAGDAS